MRIQRLPLFLLCAAALTALAGCQDEPTVKKYEVTHPDREPLRLLAAIVPHGDRTWFFKLSGPEKAVGEQKANFDAFLAALKFDDAKDPPLAWTAPAGWTSLPGDGKLRDMTFRIDSRPRKLELTVSGFAGPAGGALSNINRWRKQIGRPALEPAELETNATRQKIAGADGWVVDTPGLGAYAEPKDAAAKGAPHAFGGLPPPKAPPRQAPPKAAAADDEADLPFKYEIPKGWQKLPEGPQFSVLTLLAGAGDDRAIVTVSPLGPNFAGGVAANVERWRGQVGLPPADPAEVLKSVVDLPVDGVTAKYADAANPASRGKLGRILGVMLPLGPRTWFFKMSGPHDAVGQRKAEFETFIQSLKLGGR